MRLKELVLLLMLSLAVLVLTMGGESGSTLAVPPWTHCFGMHKITQFHLDIYSGYMEKFSDPQGIFCIKFESKDDSTSRNDDDKLTVFGLNRGNNDIIYNRSLTSIGIAGGENGADFSLNNPRDICGDPGGDLFVADTGNDRVVHLRYKDDQIQYAGEICFPGEDTLSEPMGVDACNGLVYIADTGNDRIIVTRYDGTPVKVIGPDVSGNRIFRPSSLRLAVEEDGWLYYGDYFMAVIDSFGQRLWKINEKSGKIQIIRYNMQGLQGHFDHLDSDYYSNIYVTDPDNDIIHKYDRNLRFIVAIGKDPDGLSFDEPRGISIFRRFGQLFITERKGVRYFWVGTDILDFKASGLRLYGEEKKCGVQVSFLLTEHSMLDIYLEDKDGKPVLYFMKDYLLPEGRFVKTLEVQCQGHEMLAKCKLNLVALAKPTYSSGDYLQICRKSDPLTASMR